MGAQLSCDVCEKILDEEHDKVHEKVDASPGQPTHVCVACFKPKVHMGYSKRTVYSVVGEENARRIKESPQSRANFQQALSGSQNMRVCECGAETVVREGVVACFMCAKLFE